jgi:predicted kinase
MKRPNPQLILVCRGPGSGKTRPAKQLADEVPAVRLCPDEWMAQLGITYFSEDIRALL